MLSYLFFFREKILKREVQRMIVNQKMGFSFTLCPTIQIVGIDAPLRLAHHNLHLFLSCVVQESEM